VLLSGDPAKPGPYTTISPGRSGRSWAALRRQKPSARSKRTLIANITAVFSLGDAIAEGRLVPLLEPFNPGDQEIFHAVFVGGANMPARVRVFVDYLMECMGSSRGRHQLVRATT
jgi:DNA-binding transcriptional LysR family regulator